MLRARPLILTVEDEALIRLAAIDVFESAGRLLERVEGYRLRSKLLVEPPDSAAQSIFGPRGAQAFAKNPLSGLSGTVGLDMNEVARAYFGTAL